LQRILKIPIVISTAIELSFILASHDSMNLGQSHIIRSGVPTNPLVKVQYFFSIIVNKHQKKLLIYQNTFIREI